MCALRYGIAVDSGGSLRDKAHPMCIVVAYTADEVEDLQRRKTIKVSKNGQNWKMQEPYGQFSYVLLDEPTFNFAQAVYETPRTPAEESWGVNFPELRLRADAKVHLLAHSRAGRSDAVILDAFGKPAAMRDEVISGLRDGYGIELPPSCLRCESYADEHYRAVMTAHQNAHRLIERRLYPEDFDGDVRYESSRVEFGKLQIIQAELMRAQKMRRREWMERRDRLFEIYPEAAFRAA